MKIMRNNPLIPKQITQSFGTTILRNERAGAQKQGTNLSQVPILMVRYLHERLEFIINAQGARINMRR